MGSPLDKSMDGSLTTIQIQDNVHRFASNKKKTTYHHKNELQHKTYFNRFNINWLL
jgi:hypothetical protein